MPIKPGKESTKSRVTAETQRFVDRAAEVAREKGRSRVSNAAARGSIVWLDNADRRGPAARRFKDLVALVTSDVGGIDATSEAMRQIIRRIASLSVWCESQEAKMADGDNIDINEFQRTSNSLRRLCESLGLKRVARDVDLSLGELLRKDVAQRQADDAEEVNT